MRQLYVNMHEAESASFKGFCKKVGVNSIRDFEQGAAGLLNMSATMVIDSEANFDPQNTNMFEQKAHLELQIQKKESKIAIINSNFKDKQIQALKSSLEKDQKTLKSLM